MSAFREATDADQEAWQRLLEGCPSGDFLHDWAWADVAAHDGEPQRRFVLEEAGEIVALAAPQVRRMPLTRLFWYVPHGPILDYAHPGAAVRIAALLRGLFEAAASERVVAVKLEPRLEETAAELRALRDTALRPTAEQLQVGTTRIVDIGIDDAPLLASFDKDTRYAVRRAAREGVAVSCVADAASLRAIDDLHRLVTETQRRAGFPLPPLERYRVAWRALAGVGRAVILEARRGEQLLASGMLVVEGARSFYLFAGSRREEAGEPKHYASYALQWEMMRVARRMGSRSHDLWGIAPETAGPEHPWYGVGLFKKGFGGRVVRWSGSRDLVVDRGYYRLRSFAGSLRRWIGR